MQLQLLALQVQCSFWAELTYELVYRLAGKLCFNVKGQFLRTRTALDAFGYRRQCVNAWNSLPYRNRILMNACLLSDDVVEVIWNG